MGLARIWFEVGRRHQQYSTRCSTARSGPSTGSWGDSVLGYHLANVGVPRGRRRPCSWRHPRRLWPRPAPDAGRTDSCALHPVCVESVAVGFRAEEHAVGGVLPSAAASLATWCFDETRCRRLYFLALGLFVLALLTKTVTAMPPAALLVVFWVAARSESVGGGRGTPAALACGVRGRRLSHRLGREARLDRPRAGRRFRSPSLQRLAAFRAGDRVPIFPRPARPSGLAHLIFAGRSTPAVAGQSWAADAGVAGVLSAFAIKVARTDAGDRWLVSLFRGHALSGPRVCERLPFHLFVCRGPFPVSGQPGCHRSRLAWAWAFGIARRIRGGRPVAGRALASVLTTLGVLTWRQCWNVPERGHPFTARPSRGIRPAPARPLQSGGLAGAVGAGRE